GQIAGGHEYRDLVPKRFTDAGDVVELAGGDDVGEAAFELADSAGCLDIGLTAERVFALQFQERADFLEHGGDFGLVHGPPTETRLAATGGGALRYGWRLNVDYMSDASRFHAARRIASRRAAPASKISIALTTRSGPRPSIS